VCELYHTAWPPTVSRGRAPEGEFGFLKVFCTKWDEAELTRGLGEAVCRLLHGAEALSV
jgi:hypothetical protein